jgi:excisionase family DNA binding protein
MRSIGQRDATRTSPRRRRGSEMVLPDATNQVEVDAIARLLRADMRQELLDLLREICERNPPAERLAYSPDEAAELLGISKELVHDLLRTGELGSVKAGRRRLIGRNHLEALLTRER